MKGPAWASLSETRNVSVLERLTHVRVILEGHHRRRADGLDPLQELLPLPLAADRNPIHIVALEKAVAKCALLCAHTAPCPGSLSGLLVDLLQEPRHVLAQVLHGVDSFLVVGHVSRVQPDAEVPVGGASDEHLIVEEEVI